MQSVWGHAIANDGVVMRPHGAAVIAHRIEVSFGARKLLAIKGHGIVRTIPQWEQMGHELSSPCVVDQSTVKIWIC
jgi:hypothetical protein